MNVKSLTNNIELNIIFFSLLLHTFWEGLQSYFYIFPDAMNVYPRFCWLCVTGDVLIALGSYWIISLFFMTKTWVLHPSKKQIIIFVMVGVLYTLISEYVHVYIKGTWQYSNIMPLIPYIGVGITPILQWIVIPLLTLSLIKRQIHFRK